MIYISCRKTYIVQTQFFSTNVQHNCFFMRTIFLEITFYDPLYKKEIVNSSRSVKVGKLVNLLSNIINLYLIPKVTIESSGNI